MALRKSKAKKALVLQLKIEAIFFETAGRALTQKVIHSESCTYLI
jgi:hypothetical protein